MKSTTEGTPTSTATAAEVSGYLLSYAQRRLWFLDQLTGESGRYNIAAGLELQGDLDIVALGSCLDALVRRHEPLRTTFSVEDGEPRQLLGEPYSVSLGVVDLDALEDADRAAETGSWSIVEADRGFDLSTGPLLRGVLFRRTSQDHALVLVMHHIVADGWSARILIEELSVLYRAFRAGRPSPLTELPIQYLDYTYWQREWLESGEAEEQITYWAEQMEPPLPTAQLPVDRAASAEEISNRGAHVERPFNIRLRDRALAFGREHETTLFATLLSAFSLLLARYTRQGEWMIGIPLANRDQPEIQNLIGFFVNTAALRLAVDRHLDFGALVEQVRETVVGAYTHQDLPFEEVVRRFAGERDPRRQPFFDVMFALDPTPLETLELPALTVTPMTLRGRTAKFDLTFQISERKEGGSVAAEYRTALFDRSRIERLLDHWTCLLERALDEPERPVSSLSLLTATEEAFLLGTWSARRPASSEWLDVPRRVFAQAVERGDAVAVTGEETHLSFAGLTQAAHAMAATLAPDGLEPETVIGVLMSRSPLTLTAYLAILELGGAYLPLDPQQPDARLRAMIEAAGARWVLIDEEATGRDLATAELLRPEAGPTRRVAGAPVPVCHPDQLAYLIFTSGSTGRPKGVQISHRSLANLVDWHLAVYDTSPADRSAQLASPGFDAAVWELWPTWAAGGSIHLVPSAARTAPLELRDWMFEQRLTTTFVPTPLAEALLLLPWPPQGGPRTLLTGGDRLRHRPTPNTPFRLVNHYGPTESSVVTTCSVVEARRTGAAGDRLPDIGRPIDGTRVFLLDRDLEAVPVGVTGELFIGGLGLARGYCRDAAQTAGYFLPDPWSGEHGARLYATGDLTRWSEDGRIEFLGRRDDQVKVRGFRIELGEIDAALNALPTVREAISGLRRDLHGEAVIVAWVVTREGALPSFDALRTELAECLPDYMLPSRVVELEALPLTFNGKVDLNALPDPDLEAVSDRMVAPRTTTEARLVELWRTVLELPRAPSVETSFFALGGHSLLATQLIARVRQVFDADISLSGFFAAPTVAGLAQQIDLAMPALRLDLPIDDEEEGERSLSFAQERLWFLHQIDPLAYTMPAALRWHGACAPLQLQRAFVEVIERHQVLRTRITAVDGRPRQRLEAVAPFALPLVDLEALAEEDRDRQVEEHFRTELRTAFDLSSPPLLRARLLRYGDEQFVLLVAVHHIAGDGWSIGLLAREVTGIYRALETGRTPDLPPLPRQYADFARWQRRALELPVFRRQLDYWRQQLGGEIEPLNLPADGRRREISSRGRQVRRRLDLPLSASLRQLSLQHDATLFMTLLTSFKVLLARLSGQRDLCVGTPIAGRQRGDVETLIGCFLNTLVLRSQLEDEVSFTAALKQVRRVALEAFDHQDAPFEQVLEVTHPQRDPSSTPLFRVMFNMLDFPYRVENFDGRVVEFLPLPEVSAKFDLTLYVHDGEDGIECDWVANAALFSEERLRTLVDQYEALLRAFAREPQVSIWQPTLITDTTAARWPRPERAPGQRFDRSVDQHFRVVAGEMPHRVAVVDGALAWTYGELARHSALLAYTLRRAGITAGDPVAIWARRRASLVAAVLGVLEADAAFVLIDADYPAARVATLLHRCRCRAWISIGDDTPPREIASALDELAPLCRLTLSGRVGSADNEGAARCFEPSFELPAGDHELTEFNAFELELRQREVAFDDLAYLAFTSGSTGEPKLIRGRHGSLAHGPRWMIETFGLTADDRFSLLSGLSHDPLHRDLFTPLLCGANLRVPDPGQIGRPGWLAGWMKRQRISVSNLTPAMLDLLTVVAPDDDTELDELRHALVVGDRLALGQVEVLRRLAPGVACTQLYGTTETHQALAWHRVLPAGEERDPLPLGRGNDGTEIWVRRRDGELAGVGELGEIWVRSPYLSLGYDDDELNAEFFSVVAASDAPHDRIYRTGDLGRYLPNGEVEFVGRSDLQVKIRGFRVEPAEIEARLEAIAGVRRAVVVALCEDQETLLAAYLTTTTEVPDSEILRRELARTLPSYMLPATFTTLERLPLLPNGKVDRRALPRPERIVAGSSRAPSTPEEEILAAIWCEVLDIENVGVFDDFFALGGHSLKATQVLSRVREALDVDLSLPTFFAGATVAELASAARQAKRGSDVPPVRRRHHQREVPLSFAQERLWLIDQMDPGNPTLTVSTHLRLVGEVDIAALDRALVEIVSRHQILRASFDNQRPLQVFGEPSASLLQQIDLSCLASPWTPAAHLAARAALLPFDLRRGGLLRAWLLRLASNEHHLLIGVHHIVFDGWSAGVFARELRALYRAFTHGEPSPLPALRLQYADFAVWQREWLRQEVLDQRMAYWRDQLGDAPAALELPTDRPRPSTRMVRGARLGRRLDDDLLLALDRLGQTRRTTRFMTLLSGLSALLQRYTDQGDLMVGSPIANRNQVEVEGLIGVFFNLLALRVEAGDDPGFATLLERIRRTTIDAYAHQDVPFEKVLTELQPERDLRLTPFFQVTFALQNVPRETLDGEDLCWQQLESEGRTAYFDLTLFVDETEEGVRATFEYKTDLFDATTVQRMLGHYERLLAAAVAEPERPLSRLALLPSPEAQQLLWQWNDTARQVDRTSTLPELFERRARQQPQHIAIEAAAEQVSYGELEERANRLARLLESLGAGPGVPVGLYLPRGAAMAEAVLGVQKAGAFYVPLDASNPADRLRYILSSLEVRLLISACDRLPILADLEPLPHLEHVLCLDPPGRPVLPAHDPATGRALLGRGDLRSFSPVAAAPRARAEDPAYVIFTSGSTGRPKGVQVRHRPVINLIDWLNRAFEVSAADRVLFVTSLSFDLSVYDLFGILAAGGTLRVASEAELGDPERLARILVEEPITLWDSAPAALQQLTPFLPQPGATTAALRLVLLSGDWIPLPLPDQMRCSFPDVQVISLGGATEATIWSNFFPVDEVDPHWLSIPYGFPIQNARYFVLDRHLEPCPLGVAGDLFIGGDCLADGYAGAPSLSAEKFLPDPRPLHPGDRLYRTGDRARWRNAGWLEFLGRLDHQVKIRGFRIELGEIEAVLLQHPVVHEAITLAVGDDLAARRLVAYVVATDPPTNADDGQVERWQAVYDETYRDSFEFHDPTFNIAGWHSSYTGLPIPEEEMRQWLDGTVARLEALRPQRVLELGCGTGMLLFALAPRCEEYWATDLSKVSIETLEELVAQQPGLDGVHLLQRAAHEWDGLPNHHFDLILMNSVTQHFPDAEYLVDVLHRAVDAVEDGGTVFVGDMRSSPHLRAFHASLLLANGDENLTRAALVQLLAENVEQDEQLLISSAFFHQLSHQLPRLSEVEIQLRRGDAHNELTRFRFDAILHIGRHRAAVPEEVIGWQQFGATADTLAERLDQRLRERPRALILRRVPNARLDAERAFLDWLEEKSGHGDETLGDWRRRWGFGTVEGIDPELFWTFSENHAYDLEIYWNDDDATTYDVRLCRRDLNRMVPAAETPAVEASEPDWAALTHRPYDPMAEGRLSAELRQFVGERLPEYMVPSAIVLLETMPLTANGKIDRKALPDPDETRRLLQVEYAPPESALEEKLARIWTDLMGIDQIGRNDNFFELGGHSLLATQMISRLREQFGVQMSLRSLFETPTLATLAASLETALSDSTARHATADAGTVETAYSEGGEVEGRPLISGVDDRQAPPPLVALPREREAPFEAPLSITQERLWFIEQFTGDARRYHVPLALRLEGDLDLAAIDGALSEIARRHEVLRTTFIDGPEQPLQQVHPPSPWTPSIVDLRGLDKADRQIVATTLGREISTRPFALQRTPARRAVLLQLRERIFELHLCLHHLISDGWSVGVLVEELATLYAHLQRDANRLSPLPELPVQYADFALWQRQMASGPRRRQQVEFWRRRLEGLPSVLALPTDRPRPRVQRFRSGNELFTLNPGTLGGLEALARSSDVTLFMTLVAVFSTLLGRLSAQDDFALGTPAAGRHHPATEGLIGFFVDTLVLRADLAGRPTFTEVLSRARRDALDALTHQEMPFEVLLEELRPSRDLSHSPIFQNFIALQNLPEPRVELDDLALTALLEETRPATFDLSLMAVVTEVGLEMRCLFNQTLFDRTTIRRHLAAFARLVDAVIAEPRRPIDQLPLLGPAERHLLLQENRGELDYDSNRTLPAFFAHQAELYGDAVWLVDDGGSLTYAEGAMRTTSLAQRLHELGVEAEDRVGVLAPRSANAAIALLGILTAGAVFVPFDASHPPARWQQLTATCRPRLILAQDGLRRRWPEASVRRLDLAQCVAADQTPRSPAGAASQAAPLSPDRLAYILHTSGSTGRPKGVMITHRGLFNRLASAPAAGHLRAGDRFLHKATLSFDVSLLELFLPVMVAGSTACLAPRAEQDPTTVVRFLVEQRVDQAIFPPSLLRLLLEEEEIVHCRALHSVASSAEALTQDLSRRFHQRLDAELHNRYGPTEASIAVASMRSRPDTASTSATVPIGRPIANAELLVLGPALELQPLGVPGELTIGGVCLARGYLFEPGQTARRFVPHPLTMRPGERLYRSGDKVRVLADGNHEFLGRLDRQVKVRGVRLELEEVEAAILSHAGVARGVAAVRDDGRGEFLVAYVEAVEPARFDAAELRRHLTERLPTAAVPSHIVRLDALPLLSSGKVNRRALPVPAVPRPASEPAPPPAATSTRTHFEERIRTIWLQELGLESVGVHENFFDVGGHSLLAVKVRNRLRQDLGRDLPLVDLFQFPTIASLAAHLAPSDPQPAVAPASPTERATKAEGIAILAMAGRFPGAADIDAFWDLLIGGREGITFFSQEELRAAGIDPELAQQPSYVPASGVLDEVAGFDAAFFGMSPNEAAGLDPQQRLFLECSWQALEKAGYDSQRYGGRIGVFAGLSMSSYLYQLYSRPDFIEQLGPFQVLLGNDKDFLPTRVSYKLGLRGPSVNVQTACSTSLVAVHLACQSLLDGDSDMALAGGVSISLPQESGHSYAPGMIFSPDGHCRAFSADAAGTVRGNGVGLVLLKPLSSALRDGDTVLAVIRGSAINNDGALKVGYTAPSVEGQAEVIGDALRRSGVEPSSIGYVETHGTGTALGDPVEVRALSRAFNTAETTRENGSGREERRSAADSTPIWLGSVKTNVGHLNAAAGAAGLIKTVLALQHGQLPPSLHFSAPNPDIDFAATPFAVNVEARDWPRNGSAPRRAGVSSFGIGGTNAHLVVEEAPSRSRRPSARACHLLPLSARTPTALAAMARALSQHLGQHPDLDLADVAYTLQVGRRRFSHRFALVAGNSAEARTALATVDVAALHCESRAKRPVVFLFPGQGSQQVGMAAELYRDEATFRQHLDRCAEAFLPHLGTDLRQVIFAESDREAASRRLEQTAMAQPALFAVEVALARLWMHWGIEPEAMLGHSLGEWVAAHLAGVFSLTDAAVLVSARARLMQQQKPGSMLAARLAPPEARPWLSDELELAVEGGPRLSVIAGPTPAIEALGSRLAAAGIDARLLHTSHAFHSAAMAPVIEPFALHIAEAERHEPRRPFLSSSSGTWITAEEARDPLYWARQVRQPVRMAAAIERLLAERPDAVLLEVGPGRSLGQMVRQQLDNSETRTIVHSLPQPKAPMSSNRTILEARGRLWCAGVEMDEGTFWAGEERFRVPLPTYPFERQHHWIEPATSPRLPDAIAGSPQTFTAETARPFVAPAAERSPEDAIEVEIADIWRSLLGVAEIGPDDDFFDLGGSSLLAVRLDSHFQQRFGIDQAPQAVLENPTVRQLAAYVRQKSSDLEPTLKRHPLLVELQKGAPSRRPLFLFHPAGGQVYFYRQLAMRLGADRPVYGLRAEGLEAGEEPQDRVEEIASHYLEALRSVQAQGPYCLGGSSFGGTVAFEMARQLHAAGEKIALLALIDTPGQGQMPIQLSDDAAILHYLVGEELLGAENGDDPNPTDLATLRRLAPAEQITRVVEKLAQRGDLPWDVSFPLAQRLLATFKAHSVAMREYHPQPFDGKILFFRAIERRPEDPPHPEYAWIELARGGIEIHQVPGNHLTLHQSPHIEVVAERLRQAMDDG